MLERLSLLSCTLDDAARTERQARLRALEARAVASTDDELVFPLEPTLAAELAELAALEAGCCTAPFVLRIDPAGMRLALRV